MLMAHDPIGARPDVLHVCSMWSRSFWVMPTPVRVLVWLICVHAPAWSTTRRPHFVRAAGACCDWDGLTMEQAVESLLELVDARGAAELAGADAGM